ncbi:MAG TPA: hypothetical protein DCO77_13630 [Nitrospiraceae bacterium]|nr:hypothetical protein [Nitrospiraceae bacterium]
MMRDIILSAQHTATTTFLAAMMIFTLSGTAFASEFDYTTYASLLKKYVQEDKKVKGFTLNVVDYEGLYQERRNSSSDYNRILEQLAQFNPETLSSKDHQIAFWINAYNIGAVKMILDHYPVDSIRSRKISFLKNPWGIKIVTIGGRQYSLGEIEHEILLKRFSALKAHFVIVCASLSCPELAKDVYTAGRLQAQLFRQAAKFMNDPKKGYAIDRAKKKVYVSRIFKFDKKNFGKGADVIIPFILPFVENKEDREFLEKGTYDLEFLDYEWGLNSLHSGEQSKK